MPAALISPFNASTLDDLIEIRNWHASSNALVPSSVLANTVSRNHDSNEPYLWASSDYSIANSIVAQPFVDNIFTCIIPYAISDSDGTLHQAVAITFKVVTPQGATGEKYNLVVLYYTGLDGVFGIRCGDHLLRGAASGKGGTFAYMSNLFGCAESLNLSGCHFDSRAEVGRMCSHTYATLQHLSTLTKEQKDKLEFALKHSYDIEMHDPGLFGDGVSLEEGEFWNVSSGRTKAKKPEDKNPKEVDSSDSKEEESLSAKPDEETPEESLTSAPSKPESTDPSTAPTKKERKKAVKTTETEVMEPLKASDFSIEGLLFRAPVLLEGDRGSGKTFEVRTLAKKLNVPLIELAGHASIEAWELFGQLVPTAEGPLIWKDGKLSQAFRAAQNGKVILLIDELLRINPVHLSSLLTSLSPFDGCYHLSTGRIVDVKDGVGRDEVISCPAGNLAVAATTNVGAKFAVDDLDPAIAERFIPIRKDTTESSLRAVLKKTLAEKKFNPKVADSLVKFFNVTKGLVSQGLLNEGPTTRTLNRAIELSNLEADIPKAISLQKLLWVDRDSAGHAVPEQVKLIDDSLKAAFKTT